MILAAENLSKRYGRRTVLNDVSLTMHLGQCVLVRGPSGGGKSTLLRVLSLLEPADSGYVSHGERRWDATVLRPAISPYPFLTVVFQQLFLWPNLTMSQNLSLVLGHFPNKEVPKSAMDMLECFSIERLLPKYPHECSLGERQRLAVVRALLSEAHFLLLDEPTSALDRANRNILIQKLTAAIQQGRGVLLVTHDDHGFDAIVDRVFELEHGRLEESV
jgi:ABC-type polar amino acid transport system ATPase subunit